MRSRILALFFLALCGAGLLLWQPMKRAGELRRVQDAAPGAGVEVLFLPGPPRWPDQFADKAGRWLEPVVRDAALIRKYQQWFRACFRGPVESLVVHIDAGDPEWGDRVHAKLGAALLRLEHLRVLHFVDSGDAAHGASRVTGFCTAARSVQGLDTLVINSNHITDASIAPLRGHPALEQIFIASPGVLTQSCRDTFRTLPALQGLRFGDIIVGYMHYFNPDEQKAIIAAIPSVKVYFQNR
jgi:hypothetical protein